MSDFGAPAEVLDEDALMTADIVTQFGEPPLRIDLLNAIDGVSVGEVWVGANRIVLGGQELRVIGLDELLSNKAATGRRKDAEDLRRLAARRARKRR